MKDAKVIKALGSNLRRARAAKGLNQAKLAEAAGISLQSVSNIERGRYPTTVEMLLRMADALDVSVSSLFERDPTDDVRSSQRTEISQLVDLLRDQSPEVIKEVRAIAAAVLGIKRKSRPRRRSR